MKNIEKKWTLFLIATFVTFFGIVNVLVKGTKANEIPVNSNFDDINFYKAVVDAYNYENDTSYDYTYNLSDEELAEILNIGVFGYSYDEGYEITSFKGIEKLSNLSSLFIENVMASTLDLSNNDKLEILSIYDGEQNIKNINLDLSDKVDLYSLFLSNISITELDLSNNDKLESLKIYDDNQNIKSINLDLSDKVDLGFLSLENVLITELDLSNNDKLESLSIYDGEQNIKNINLDLSDKVDLYSLFLENISITELDLSNNDALEYIRIINKDTKLTDLTLNLVDKTDLFELSLSGCELSELDLSNNNKIEILDIYDCGLDETIVLYVGDTYVLNHSIILPSNSLPNESYWEVTDESIASISENNVLETYTDGITSVNWLFKEIYALSFDVFAIKIVSNKYLINDNKIVVDTRDIDEIKSNIDYDQIVDLDIDEDVSILKLMHEGTVVKEFEIIVDESNNDNDDGEILDDIIFDTSLSVDYDNMLISGILVDTTVDDIKEKVNTNYIVQVLDKEGNIIEDSTSVLMTGYKIQINLNEEEYILYNLSILGDINGDGQVTKDDMLKIAKYIIVNQNILGNEYVVAADVNKDGNIGLSDFVKLAKYIVNGSEL